jgi:AcrR family transcriptional regulator
VNGLSGRRGQARRNDELILESARAVFIADPDAPIAAVAKHAGVGISALYRRYAGKEELLRKLCGDGLRLYVQIARRAVEEGTEDHPWDTFARFMRRIVEADTHTLTINLAGRFQPTEDLAAEGATAEELNALIVKRAQKAGVLRKDIGPHDLSHIFEQIANVHGPTPERTRKLRSRYLVLQLDGLRGPAGTKLPGPPPTGEEQAARWIPHRHE